MKKIVILLTQMFFALGALAQSTTWSTTGNSNQEHHSLGTTDAAPVLVYVGGTGDYNRAGALTMDGSGVYLGNTTLGQASYVRPHVTMRTTAFGAYSQPCGANSVAIGTWTLNGSGQGNGIIAIGVDAMSQMVWGAPSNIAIGTNTMIRFKSGNNNVGIGANIMNVYSGTGCSNTAVGMQVLCNATSAGCNTSIGAQSLMSNSSGSYNSAFGSGALVNNTSGSNNTAIGNSALWYNSQAEENTAIGDEALAGNLSGQYNVAIGTRALWYGDNNPGFSRFGDGGNRNTGIGLECLPRIKVYQGEQFGYGNVSLGSKSSLFTTKGYGNVAIGYYAMGNNKTGANNIIIGYNANVQDTLLANVIAIGREVVAKRSNSVLIGNNAIRNIGGSANWTTRVKKGEQNYVASSMGLEFVKSLSPILYKKQNDPMVYTGFKIESVVQAVHNQGSSSFGGIDNNEGIRYDEFIGVLVKAVQELAVRAGIEGGNN